MASHYSHFISKRATRRQSLALFWMFNVVAHTKIPFSGERAQLLPRQQLQWMQEPPDKPVNHPQIMTIQRANSGVSRIHRSYSNTAHQNLVGISSDNHQTTRWQREITPH
ncbi:hypothetical protein An08g05600 [Aspergillus niger]|uniref:Uncharacterized protein n=2 Tax=Aspergillus niger TaxID=5061 RepID=A2QRD1_ASPNC|nr:hypothetical protein An08g05600 [Aspergillus niger]CAK45532.1 hypothetical protein An08g05600 [Aspergillus niger]